MQGTSSKQSTTRKLNLVPRVSLLFLSLERDKTRPVWPGLLPPLQGKGRRGTMSTRLTETKHLKQANHFKQARHFNQAKDEKQEGEAKTTKVFQASKGLKHPKEGTEKMSLVVYGTLHVTIHRVPTYFQKCTLASYFWC